MLLPDAPSEDVSERTHLPPSVRRPPRIGRESATHQYARTMFGIGIPEIVVFWILVALAVWLLVRRKAH